MLGGEFGERMVEKRVDVVGRVEGVVGRVDGRDLALGNLARHLKIDPEQALRGSSSKFERRFHHMEVSAADDGQFLSELNEEQLDQRWRDAKTGAPGKGRDL